MERERERGRIRVLKSGENEKKITRKRDELGRERELQR